MQRGTLKLNNIKTCIIDEADEMLNMGFIDNVKEIMGYFPGNLTTCLFSATYPPAIQELATSFIPNANMVEIASTHAVTELVTHYAYRMKEHEKLDFLIKLLCQLQPASCIIFAKTQEHVKEVCDALYKLDLSVDKIHGGMLQEDRMDNLNDFKKGKLRILGATDVAARGIDIKDVSHIINYDMPNQAETYVHRLGRSGRVNASGVAISLIAQYDGARVAALEEFLNESLDIKDTKEILEVIVDEQALEGLRHPIEIKEEKGKELRKDTMKIYLNGGKSKKIRAGDIVGAICEIEGVTGDDIGVIQIQDRQSYVDILHGKGKIVLKALQKKTIKGKQLKVQKAKD